MSKITRRVFEAQHAGKSIDPGAVEQDPSAHGKLSEAGLSPAQLRSADLNRDGEVDAQEAFKLADRFDSAPSGPDELIAKDRAGAATPAGKALSTLGLLMQNRGSAAGAAPADVDLDEMEDRFDQAADKLHADPAAISSLRGEFRSVVDELEPVIEHKEGKKAVLDRQIAAKEEHLNWFERNVGLFTPKEVADLKDKSESLGDYLEEAKAYRGGARLALRGGQEADPDFDPGSWSSKLYRAEAGVPSGSGPERERGVAELVKVQDEVSNVTDRARLDQRSVESDVGDYREEVGILQRWKWVDVVCFGESARGALYRSGKAQNESSTALLKDFTSVEARGEAKTKHEVSELLKLESPEYKTKRDRYDLLKPAYDGLNSTLGSSRDAQSHLKDAEYWIDRRDWLQITEPTMMETIREPRYRYDADGQRVLDGYDTSERETSEHQQWRSDLSNARSQASWASSSAEREVDDVNRSLPPLSRALAAIEEGTELELVDDDISTWWANNHGTGYWSFDSMEVDEIQGQLRELDTKLNRVKGRVDPQYNSHHRYVFGEIASRRSELRLLETD